MTAERHELAGEVASECRRRSVRSCRSKSLFCPLALACSPSVFRWLTAKHLSGLNVDRTPHERLATGSVRLYSPLACAVIVEAIERNCVKSFNGLLLTWQRLNHYVQSIRRLLVLGTHKCVYLFIYLFPDTVWVQVHAFGICRHRYRKQLPPWH